MRGTGTNPVMAGGRRDGVRMVPWDARIRACAVDHPRLAALYVMAAQCWQAGRLEEAVRYSDAASGAGAGR